MSATVDSRVLEMRFDNKEFEANAQETINTLNTLKRALDENVNGSAFEELDRAARNVDLSSIEHSLDSLTDRFSTLGIVGMRVIENLTDGLMNLVHRGLNYVTDAISSGGIKRAMNIENARFQLQGLIDDEKEVEAIMKNAQQSVSDTAYSYDEAAKAASMFAATGLRSGEQMQSALDGIAGVAATTNSDYESMAQIFTTVAGNGRLMGDQLLQLSTRGMNAAAVLRNFFNEVRDGSRDASDHVKDFVNQLSGMNTGVSDSSGNTFDNYDDAIKSTQKAFNKQYKERQKALNKEFEVIKKGYDEEYNSLKKTLDGEYNAKKKAYDEEYQALSESLSKEIQEVQKANAQRLKEANEAYSDQVNAYREATEARIQLINDEYLESIKLIDEERYNKLKAIDDELKAMQELEEAESRQRINEANAEKKATIEDLANRAKSKRARLEAAEAVADVNKAIADQQEAWRKQDRKKELSEQKDQINEDANLKKQEALSKKDAAVKSVQDEASAKLKEMQKAHEVEIEQMRESQQVQIEELQKSKQAQLETLRESQQNELSQYRETQQLQLQSFRETQQEELEAIRERNQEELEALRELNNDKLSEMKEASKVGVQALKDFNGEIGFTEEQIRDMVSKGLIDFETFAEAMDALFGDHAKDANKTFSGAMANIRAALARTGAMFAAPFLEQEGPMVKLFNVIRVKINEMNAALAPVAKIITANILQAVINLTDRIENLRVSLTYMVKDANGNVKEYSKLSTIASVLVNIFKGLADIFMAIGSYISPIINAFKEIFSIDYTGLLNASKSFRDFTRDLGASEEIAKIIHDAFAAFFTLIKNGISIVVNFIKEFKPLHTLVGLLASGINFLATGISIVIGSFVEWVATCKPLQDVLDAISYGLDRFSNKLKILRDIIITSFKNNFGGFDLGSFFAEGFLVGFKNMAKAIIDGVIGFFKDLILRIRECLGIHSPAEETEYDGKMTALGYWEGFKNMMSSVVDWIIDMFKNLLNKIRELLSKVDWAGLFTNALNSVTYWITTVTETIANGIPLAGQKITEFFDNLKNKISNVDFTIDGDNAGLKIVSAIINGIWNAIKALGVGIWSVAKALWDLLSGYFEDFSIKDAVSSAINFVLTFVATIISKLGEWGGSIGEAIKNLFGNLDETGILAISAGIGIIYMFIKACNALFKLMHPMASITMAINGLKQAFLGFALDMKANALLKISASILIIVAAIGLMYKIFESAEELDNEVDVWKAVGIVTLAVGGIAAMMMAIAKIQSSMSTTEAAAAQLNTSLRKFANAIEIKIVISSIISALSAIVLDIAALATVYASNEEGFKEAANTVGDIVLYIGILVAALVVLSSLLNPAQLQTFAAMSGSFLALSAGIMLMIFAIQKITKMEIRKSDLTGLAVLAGVILLVGTVMGRIVEATTWITAGKEGQGSLEIKIGTIIAFALLMMAAIKALKQLIKEGYTIRNTYPQLLMLAAIMAIITIVCVAMADAGKQVGGVTKYGNAVIGLAALLIASLYALKKLIEIPFEDYIQGLGKLSGVFVAMSIVVYAASLVSSNDGYKSILAVGMLVGALMVVLGVMSMFDPTDVLVGVGALSVLLLAIAAALSGAGAVSQSTVSGFASIMAMVVFMIAIGVIMENLLKYNWQQILSVSGSIALVLLAMGSCVAIASDSKINKGAIAALILGVAAIAVVGIIIWKLNENLDWKQLLSLGGSIAAVLLSMGVAIKILGSKELKVSISAVETMFISLLAILVIGLIIGNLAKQPWDRMLSLGASIALVLLSLGESIRLLGSSEYKIDKGALKGYLLGLGAIVTIGWTLSTFETQPWYKGLLFGRAISSVLLALGECINNIGSIDRVDKSAIASMFLGTLAIVAIGWTLSTFSTQPWDKTLSLAASISLVILALGKAINEIGNVKIIDGDSITAMFVGILAIIVIGVIISMLAETDATWDKMLSLSASISIVLLAMGEAIKILGSSKNMIDNDTINAMLTGILAIVVIGVIIGLCAQQPWYDMVALGASISAVLLAMGEAINIIGSSENEISNSAISSMIVGLIGAAVIGVIIGKLAEQPWDQMLSLGTAISEVLLAMGKAVQIMADSGGSLPAGYGGEMIIGLIGVAVIGAIIGMLAQQPWDQMLSLGTAISEVLLAMATSIDIMSIAGNINLTVLATFAAGVAAVWGIAAIVQEYSAGLDPKAAIGLSVSIAVLLVAVSIICALAAILGAVAVEALIGIGVIDLFIADLAVVLYALANLTEIDILKDGGEKLALIGKAIGDFIGSFIGGALEKMSNALPTIGKNLSDFVTNASSFFFDILGKFDDKMVSAAKAFSLLLITLGAAELLDAVTNLISVFTGGGDLSSYGEKLAAFGESMQLFYDNTKKIASPNRMEKLATAATALLEMGQLVPNEGGLLGWFVGENPLDKYGEALAIFSGHLITVDENFAKIKNPENFGTIAEAMTSIIKMAESVPNAGGKVAEFLGDNTLDTFGAELALFSSHLKTVGINFGKVTNLDKFQKIADAMESIIKIAIDIPNAGGWIASFIGDNELGTFGVSIRKFSEQICAAAVYAESANLDIMGDLAESIKKMIGVAKYVKDNKLGEGNWFTKLAEGGDNSLVGFGETLLKFSRSISEMTSRGNLDNVDKFQKLVTTLERFTKITETLKIFNGDNFINFLNDLGNKGSEGVTKFLNAFNDIDIKINEAVTKLFASIRSVMEKESNLIIFKNAGKNVVESFIKGLTGNDAKKSIDNASGFLISYLGIDLTKPLNSIRLIDAARTLMEIFSKAMNSNEVHNMVRESSETLIDFITGCLVNGNGGLGGAIQGNRKFIDAGKEDANAFLSGFDYNKNRENFSNTMWNFAVDVSNVLYERRVTRLFEDAGKNAAYGFSDGLRDSRVMDDVRSAAQDMAYEAYDSAMEALDAHSPSRKMMQVGGYAGEGFAIGFEDWVSSVGEIGEDIGETAIDGLKDALKNISSEIQNEDDFNPVITPVLDLSNIENGVGQIGGMLDINDPIRFNTSNIVNPMTTQTDQLREGYMMGAQFMFDKMSEELEYYKEQNSQLMSTMSDYLSHLQVVMDTGELVGVLTNPIDNELGFNKVLNERGVR